MTPSTGINMSSVLNTRNWHVIKVSFGSVNESCRRYSEVWFEPVAVQADNDRFPPYCVI